MADFTLNVFGTLPLVAEYFADLANTKQVTPKSIAWSIAPPEAADFDTTSGPHVVLTAVTSAADPAVLTAVGDGFTLTRTVQINPAIIVSGRFRLATA